VISSSGQVNINQTMNIE